MNYSNEIMNIQSTKHRDYRDSFAYKCGHRDARHSAAEIAIQADKRIAELTEALEQAKRFAELVECWGRTDCELYKHELKASADLAIERINNALDEDK